MHIPVAIVRQGWRRAGAQRANSAQPKWLHRAARWGTVSVRPRGPEPVPFFSAPWEVVEGDVGGCGPRHFLTGTKLLAGVWDRLVNDARLSTGSGEELNTVSWVVLEHGLRALA